MAFIFIFANGRSILVGITHTFRCDISFPLEVLYDRCYCGITVSYTHLDVYKRQQPYVAISRAAFYEDLKAQQGGSVEVNVEVNVEI